jgi:hypothetical protein
MNYIELSGLVRDAQRFSISSLMQNKAIELGLIKRKAEIAISLGEDAFFCTMLLKLHAAPADVRLRYIEFLKCEVKDGRKRESSRKCRSSSTDKGVVALDYLLHLCKLERSTARVRALNELVRYTAPNGVISQRVMDNLLSAYLKACAGSGHPTGAQGSPASENDKLALDYSAAINAAVR